MHKTHVRRRSSVTESNRDCARCATSLICWSDQLPISPDFTVRSRTHIRRGETLFRQSERFRGIYIVASGCFKLREVHADGTERILAFCVTGDLIGLEGRPRNMYPHSAIAADDAAFCELEWPMTRSELGSYLGLAEETVVRALGILRGRAERKCRTPKPVPGPSE